MRTIHKTSFLICLTIFVVFSSFGIIANWPTIARSLNVADKPAVTTTGADPFSYNPPLPSNVRDLRPAYAIEAELHTHEAKISGKLTVSFDNPKTTDLRFYLYDYPWSPMTIKSIRRGEQSLPFQRRDAVVRLDNVFGTEQRGALTIEFEAAVPRRGTRFGVKDDIWTLTTWYPMLGAVNQQGLWYEPPKRIDFGDPFVFHYADYDVSFISPDGYKWVSSWGKGERKTLGDGKQQIRYQGKRLLNFALVGSPLYHVETIRVEPNLTVDIASVDKRNLERIKTIANEVFPTYTRLNGPLPYPHVAIAETSTGTTYAMEYANMAIFKRDMHAGNLVDHWLPHEVAHMWWYNSVATLEATYGWIDEGLVEISVYHYKRQRYGDGLASSVVKEYEEDLERLKRRYPYGKIGKSLHQFSTYDEFDWTWYSKGALLYDNLRRQIGDAAFSQFLQRVQRNYHGSVIGPEHLDQALGQVLNGEARYFVPNSQRVNNQPFAPVYLEPYVTTVLNGISFYPAVPAREINGTVYVPLRDVSERLGYRVSWAADQQSIRIQAGTADILLQEYGQQAVVANKRYDLGQPMREIKGRTMVPLSFFERVLGLQVVYDPSAKLVKFNVREQTRQEAKQ